MLLQTPLYCIHCKDKVEVEVICKQCGNVMEFYKNPKAPELKKSELNQEGTIGFILKNTQEDSLFRIYKGKNYILMAVDITKLDAPVG